MKLSKETQALARRAAEEQGITPDRAIMYALRQDIEARAKWERRKAEIKHKLAARSSDRTVTFAEPPSATS